MSNVDTLKLLGSLLGNSAVSKGSGASILQAVLGGSMGGQSQQSGGLAGVLGAVLAYLSSDLKKVLAYSTSISMEA